MLHIPPPNATKEQYEEWALDAAAGLEEQNKWFSERRKYEILEEEIGAEEAFNKIYGKPTKTPQQEEEEDRLTKFMEDSYRELRGQTNEK